MPPGASRPAGAGHQALGDRPGGDVQDVDADDRVARAVEGGRPVGCGDVHRDWIGEVVEAGLGNPGGGAGARFGEGVARLPLEARERAGEGGDVLAGARADLERAAGRRQHVAQDIEDRRLVARRGRRVAARVAGLGDRRAPAPGRRRARFGHRRRAGRSAAARCGNRAGRSPRCRRRHRRNRPRRGRSA